MILTWSDLEQHSEAIDVAIVGGGAAGLAIADSLLDSGLNVVVLEAGGEKKTPANQDPYQGELADPSVHPWLHHFRVRAAGGASQIWGGRCMPFDAIDFAQRPWVPGPGWPFPSDVLTPYYRAAQVAAEAGDFDYDPASVLPGRPPAFASGLDGPLIATTLERFSRPTNFWTRFKGRIEASRSVHIVLNAPVTRVQLTLDGGEVEGLQLQQMGGAHQYLRAKRYVLAAGGLETVRLLLASNDVKVDGIGGDYGHLGRYYMSHLAATVGQIAFNRANEVAFDYDRDASGVYVRRRIALTADAQRRIEGLNIIFRTHLPDAADPSHRDPILSAMFLVKDLVLYEYSRKMREQTPKLKDRLHHLGNIAADPLRLVRFADDWIKRRILADRKLPSVVLGSRQGIYALEFHAEQAPNPLSRITLSESRDGLGMQRLHVDWRTMALDMESLERSYALLAEELKRTGVGELSYTPENLRERTMAAGAYGGHHLGGARMAADAREGVVDADCRVHGAPNLFIASSAVFPTSSQANPTLTILALSLRLADRLRADIGMT